MRQQDLLIHKLKEYAGSDMYPFHMPGHKRTGDMGFPDPFTMDITEVDGFDNLHHPEGILKSSMDWAAQVYGADQTYYLVNGSSSGILSAVCGAVPRGGRILVSRNCHKSVYHGICLNQLKASYVYPQEIDGLGIQGGILPSDVDMMLKRYMDTQAVLIVSPTYDGVVSDIKGIAQVVHRAGLPLIVDEAHGAHFRYGEMFPVSALDLGADVVIQSVHKTMPSLTQTALLHIRNNRPDRGCYADQERIDRYIHMVQSSSPSYVLMASIENSIYQMERMDMEPYRREIMKLRERLKGMGCLRLVDTDIIGQYGIHDLDVSKIVVSTRKSSLTGADLDRVLRREYHLEMEMCGADYVTAITTPMDRDEGLRRLGDALMEIDNSTGYCNHEEDMGRRGSGDALKTMDSINLTKSRISSVYSMRSDTAMTIADAMDGKHRKVRLEDCAGSISGEFIYIYPPGIPIIVPGEQITGLFTRNVRRYMEQGLNLHGLCGENNETISVVKEQAEV